VTAAPAAAVWLVGLAVTIGAARGAVTVNVAALVAAVFVELVKTARNKSPFCDKPAVKLHVVEVAPAMFEYVLPVLVLTCHCTLGVGKPAAAAVSFTTVLATTAWVTGLVVTTGAVGAGVTVSLAAAVVRVPRAFVKLARYRSPFSAAVAAKAAPAMLVKVAPSFVLTCHLMAGGGLPVAVAVNATNCPAITVWFVG